MPDHKWWADALDAIGNHDAAEQMRGAMPNTDLAAVVARVRPKAERARLDQAAPVDVIDLCDAVERLTAELDRLMRWIKTTDPQIVQHIAELTANRDRLRQVIADLLAKCPACGGSSLQILCPTHAPIPCAYCTDARKAMEER